MNYLLKYYFPPGIAFDFFHIPVNLYVSASDLLLLNNLINMCLQTWLQQETNEMTECKSHCWIKATRDERQQKFHFISPTSVAHPNPNSHSLRRPQTAPENYFL